LDEFIDKLKERGAEKVADGKVSYELP